MTLFCLIVIILSIGYIAYIAHRYSEYVSTTKPYIADVVEQNQTLRDEIRTEKEELRAVADQLRDEEIVVKDLKLGVSKAEEDIAEEKNLHEKLELASQMKQFNKGKG